MKYARNEAKEAAKSMLQGVWTALYNLPVVPFTAFNDTLVIRLPTKKLWISLSRGIRRAVRRDHHDAMQRDELVVRGGCGCCSGAYDSIDLEADARNAAARRVKKAGGKRK